MSDYRTAAVALVMLLLLDMAARAQQSPNRQNFPPAAQQLTACAAVQAPVCAVLAGDRQSYWNECLAERAGAIVLRAGECPNRSFIGY